MTRTEAINEILTHLDDGQIIQAIKAARSYAGVYIDRDGATRSVLGLKEAKDIIDTTKIIFKGRGRDDAFENLNVHLPVPDGEIIDGEDTLVILMTKAENQMRDLKVAYAGLRNTMMDLAPLINDITGEAKKSIGKAKTIKKQKRGDDE